MIFHHPFIFIILVKDTPMEFMKSFGIVPSLTRRNAILHKN